MKSGEQMILAFKILSDRTCIQIIPFQKHVNIMCEIFKVVEMPTDHLKHYGFTYKIKLTHNKPQIFIFGP